MNIEELNTQLDYLKETKNLIKQQLIAKGQPVDDNTTFREYVDNMDVLIDTESGNIETNDLELGKIAYSQGSEIIGTYDTEKDIGVQPLEVFEISDDQSDLRQYYSDGVEQGGMEALASLKCWQILFVENTLNSDGVPTKHSVEFLSWTPAIVEIDRPRDMLSNSGKHRFLFDQAHTQLFSQFDTALGLGYTEGFLNTYNITTVELQAMSGWYEDINGVLTPMQSNPVYNNLMITYLFEETLQDVISGVKNPGMPYMNIDEVKLNCTFTKFNDYDEEQPVMDFVIERYRDDGDVTADVLGKDKIAYGVNGKIVGNVPIYDENNYLSLPKNLQLNPTVPVAQYDFILPNLPVSGVEYLMSSGGVLIDISKLPDDIIDKEVFISKNHYKYSSSDYWSCTLIIAPKGSIFKGYYHDSTYDVYAQYNGSWATLNIWKTNGLNYEPDINNVNWDIHITTSNFSQLNGRDGFGDWYCSGTLWSGSTVNPPTPHYNGGSEYRYLQKVDMKDKTALTKENTPIYIPIHTSKIVEQENITADKIKAGETILGVTGTYAGSAMKEYTSVTDMNNDISNIATDEVVKVVESGTTSYFIKETISGTATMTKLVKESETMSPQEYTDANDIADEILGE